MENFKEKYYRLKFLFVELISKIDNLTEENNFFDKLNAIRKEIAEVQSLKDDLMAYSDKEELKKMEPEIANYAKQIREKFDYIIEQKRNELGEIALRVKNLQNSRKLVNYRR